ncbi:MAG TPA: nicotinate-nucleotide adenylyltransferase [Candidatus Dormibacteraeota bacterium]|nr:nicotinate-nucleotide adenylyltransferase [Candidatus Dormibacteraeota bacterium]
MRLGIFGGTFDPIHIGHIAAAGAAMECAHLDRVIFIPSAQPPHRAAATAPAEDRLAMTNLAMQREPRFEVSDVEVTRGGRSYTADTLAELAREHPSDELFLILGWDAARLFRTWHEPDRVSKLSSVVIVDRPGLGQVNASELAGLGLDPARVVRCHTATPDVSASALRRAIAAGRPVTGQLPPAVERYIAEHRLYSHPARPLGREAG